jgi:hypothetical protein
MPHNPNFSNVFDVKINNNNNNNNTWCIIFKISSK